MSLNHIVIMGRCTREPEFRTTQSGTIVANVTVAVDRDFARDGASDKTDFINVTAWRGTGEFLTKYFHRGSMIVVSGRLQSRHWEDKNGSKRTDWEINAESIYFGGDKKSENSEDTFKAVNVSAVEFEELPDDGGTLPF